MFCIPGGCRPCVQGTLGCSRLLSLPHANPGAVALPSPRGARAWLLSLLFTAQGCAAPALLTAASLAGSSRSQSVASSPYAPPPPAEPQLKKMEPPSEGKVSGERWAGAGGYGDPPPPTAAGVLAAPCCAHLSGQGSGC